MKRFWVLILLLSCVLSIPRLVAQSSGSSPTPPSGSLTESWPLVCLPEAELATIIQEEVSRAVDLAVQQAVAEERGKRAAAEAVAANLRYEVDRWKGISKGAGIIAGVMTVTMVFMLAAEIFNLPAQEYEDTGGLVILW